MEEKGKGRGNGDCCEKRGSYKKQANFRKTVGTERDLQRQTRQKKKRT